jgi:hypothetical protein
LKVHFVVSFCIPVTLYVTPTVYEPLGNDILSTPLSVCTNGQHFNWHVTAA